MRALLLSFFVLPFLTLQIHAQWNQLKGPGVTGTLCLFEKDGAVYAGTSANGVYKSTDEGNNWFSSNNGLEDFKIKAIAANDNYIFAATEGEQNGNIFRSSDGGNNWELASSGIEIQAIYSIFGDGGNVYVGTVGGGIFKSTDNGSSWFESDDGIGLQSVKSIAKNGGNLYAAGDNNLYFSSDEGASWSQTNGGQFFILFSLASFNDLMVAGGFQGLIRSTDGGSTWSNVIWLDTLLTFERLVSFTFDGTTLLASTMGGEAAGIIKSTDLGLTWTKSNDGIENVDVSQVLFTDNKWFAASEGKGVMVSAAGDIWTKNNAGLPPGGIIRDVFNYKNTIIAGTGFDGIYQSLDHGITWNKLDPDGTLRNETILSITSKDNYIFAGTSFHGIFRSSDNGNSWEHLTNGLPSTEFSTGELDTSGNNVLAGTGDALYWSTDHGDTWIPSSISSATISGIASAGGYAYSIASTGISATSGVYRSSNDGISWDLIRPSNSTTPVSIAARDSFVYVGDISAGIITSYNYGLGFINSGLEQYGVFSILPLGDSVYVGTQEDSPEAFKSDSYGIDWFDIGEGLVSPLAMETMTYDDQYIYGGTPEKGIWARPRFDVVAVKEGTFPYKYELSQNFPNPFNPTTKISYQIPEISFVTLKVYDILGNEVATLVNDEKAAGKYEADFNAKNLSSGIYFYRLQAGNFIRTFKMVLLK
jgi:photosystem II stability/assembly factor-like uncharacterized protein